MTTASPHPKLPYLALAAGNPVFVALGERLEALRQRHEQGLIIRIEFLKLLLELAKT